MSKHTYIIDGYNAIHRIPQWADLLDKNLATAREALCSFCAEWLSNRKDAERFIVVFDGDSNASPFSSDAFKGVRIIYTPTGETADSRIVELVRSSTRPQDFVVVSDDGEVFRKSRAAGAKTLSVREFVNTGRPSNGTAGSHSGNDDSDGKLSPAQQNQITRDLARIWNVE